MANTKSAKKAVRVNARKRVTNLSRESKIKEVVKAISKSNDSKLFSKLQSTLDKAVKSAKISRNKANRIKSKFSTKKV